MTPIETILGTLCAVSFENILAGVTIGSTLVAALVVIIA